MKVLKERFDTLSDAIIAIAMTILVLEIGVPATQAGLPDLLEEIGLFLVSFFMIINFWYRRLRNMRASTVTTYPTFVCDVIAHALIALYPLSIKFMVHYPDKRLGILFFGVINVVTQFLLSLMAVQLSDHAIGKNESEDADYLKGWMRRRMVMGTVMDVVILIVALCLSQIGIYFYLLSPFTEFLTSYNRGRKIEKAIDNGATFTDLLQEQKARRPHQNGKQKRGRKS